MEVGFIGLGAMGSAMAANLAKAGHIVRAWNRSGVPGVDGVQVVASPRDAMQGDTVFTMVADDPAIRAVLLDSGILEQARTGIVHVVASTISVELAQELADAHDRLGLGYVSAPVLGRPNAAAQAQLNILAGGSADAVGKVRPLLEVLGKRVWDIGEDPRRANAAKIAANMMITMAIEAIAEAVVLTESTGLPRDAFFELILCTLFGSRTYESYSAIIANQTYEPGFKARLGLKDLDLAAALATSTGSRLPMLDAVRGRMGEAVVAGLADKDWSIMADFTINHAK